MGLCLIAESSFLVSLASTVIVILKVAAGLGAVIFVHELGHFLVAKACGVKCEKFYVGFDVPIKIFGFPLPRTFWKRQWGETEYGIGIIPLGGYVKMLGQDDNPANYQAEAERTRIRKTEETATESTVDDSANTEALAADTADAKETAATKTERGKAISEGKAAEGLESGTTLEAADQEEEFELDPRSFPAKRVWQRMLIISAGVAMNLVFAVIFASIAYWLGVKYTPCVVGATVPGGAAYEANLQPGSKVVGIGKNAKVNENLRYRMDLVQNVAITGGKEDITLLMRNPDGTMEEVTMRPVVKDLGTDSLAMIGVVPASEAVVAGSDDVPPVIAHMPAGKSKEPFQVGDKIVELEINGTTLKIPDYFALRAALVQHPEDQLTFIVDRKVPSDGEDSDSETKTKRAKVVVNPNPMRRVGLVMSVDGISCIQKDSPAEKAGFKVGDVIVSVDGEKAIDPLTLPEITRRRAGQEITVVVRRGDAEKEITVTPRLPIMQGVYRYPDTPVSVQALGFTLPVLNKVKAVEANSPAAKAGMKPGDRILKAEFVAANEEQEAEEEEWVGLNEIELGDERNWMQVFKRMQSSLPDTKVKFTFTRDGKEKTALVQPESSDEWYVPSRGFLLAGHSKIHVAESFGEAVALGFRNTKESLLHVVKFLKKLFTGKVSPKNLGGPAMIAVVAGSEAKVGLARLLLFLTLLSANLAIINFLPIPVLDGGHMLFLLYEGVMKKPVNEVWAMRLTVAGLVFILGLMVFVISLDVYRIAQWLGA